MMTLTSLIGASSIASSVLFGAIEPPAAPEIHLNDQVYTAPAWETNPQNHRLTEYLNSGISTETDSSDRARGIDISNWQHTTHMPVWQSIASDGFAFAFVKATEGTWYTNPNADRDIAEAKASGVLTGQYHYGKPRATSDPEAEAQYFYDHMDKNLSMPPVLDIEDTDLGPEESVEWAAKFLSKIEELSGQKPIVYTYPSFWRGKMNDSTRFSDAGYPLWIAQYHDRTDPVLPLPGGWKNWLIWQNSDSGDVSGISAKTDTNYFNGSRDDLENLVNS